jgi:hypothetical protein
MTGQKHHFAGVDGKGKILQGFVATGITLGDLVKLNHALDSP